MIKQLLTAAIAVMLIFAFSTVALSQGKDEAKAKTEMKGEMKKGDMMKEDMSGLKTLACDPACGFRVTSHDEAEILSMTKEHVKAHHADMSMTDAQIKEMIKPAKMMKREGMMDKKMDKKMDEKKPDGK